MGMITIKNYSMPHNCYDCDLHNYHECDLTSESIEEDYCWNGDSREKHCPLREVEAIPKADYENRLKADMVAILDEIDLELAEQQADFIGADNYSESYGVQVSRNVIREKINALKEKKNENK